jgi:hypothetical protein
MTAYAELEIGLHRRDAGGYAVELRFSPPDSDAEVQLVQAGQALVQLDVERFRGLALDGSAYGKLLGQSLFADPSVRTLFYQASSNAQALGAPLRVRLFIGPSAPELHDVLWETLRDPRDGSPLLTGEHIFFSRYLSSQDWRRVHARAKSDLRALVAIANPADLAGYRPGGRPLAPLDVAGELARAKVALGTIPVTELASGGQAGLNRVSERLRDGYDILYLACHGALPREDPPGRPEPVLWLEEEDGSAAVVPGAALVERLRELQQPPRLVVLASCQSAGSGADARIGDGGALAALGPRLAECGIPAVLAMQGNITIETIAEFTPVFFRELRHDGQIDRAMALARGAVRGRPDSWMPVLFMRLKSGRIWWYEPGFAPTSEGFKKWPSVLPRIQEGTATPILGPGLVEPLIGSSRSLAQRWARTHGLPLAPDDRDDLPQVAQYLAVKYDLQFPREELGRYVRNELLQQYGGNLPDELAGAPPDRVLEAVWAQRQATNPAEAHRVLARFPFPIYITANPDNLLTRALEDAGKAPEVVLCPWNRHVERLRSIYQEEPDYQPTPKRPLVYHLFGQLREPRSLVLTEDDHFKYLIGVARNRDLIPEEVRRALTDSTLLFLGFQLRDWNFRVLFHSLIGEELNPLLLEYAHVGVQIDPEERQILSAEGARQYLEDYFKGARINIYWGSTEDFVKQLLPRSLGGSAGDGSRVAQGVAR